MAYFPASSTFEGILGELYCAAFNGPAFDWNFSPSVTELENVAMDWLVDLLGLPAGFNSGSTGQGGGMIMSTTTESLITTMAASRDRFVRQLGIDHDIEKIKQHLVVLGSSETHPSTSKAASVIGVQYRSINCSSRNGTALDETSLRELIENCTNEGLIPFYLTATLGKTSTCAMDDFAGIRDVA